MIENLEGEIWKDVVGYEDRYKISSHGRLISKLGKWSNGIYKGETLIIGEIGKPQGYYRVALFSNFKYKKFRIHQLVANTYLDNPLRLPFINHKDGNKLNNHVDNLEWCTAKENINHAISIGLLIIKGENAGPSKITLEDALLIKKLLKENKLNYKQIANSIGNKITPTMIGRIKRGLSWNHI